MTEIPSKDPVIVVVQLSGGNDYMNTVVPHSNSLYRDYRPSVNINEADVIELTSEIGFHHASLLYTSPSPRDKRGSGDTS